MGSKTPLHGLSEAEARRRLEAGGGNASPVSITKSAGQIVREHVCTLFNLFNLLIAAALALVGAWSNLLFILIIALNTAIGIVQELHAKRLVEQIAVLTAPKVRVLRDGEIRELPVEELVLGDVLTLERGVQIPADALVLDGEIETDESLLTGESVPVGKTPGDELLSGSVVVSGACMARVERVGADNYAARLTQEAKAAAPVHSELLTSMQRVTRFTGFLIPPLGLLLFFQAYVLRGTPLFGAVTTTAAGLFGMLPKGLVLLITVSLAVGVAKLAKSRVLVQNLFSLESLAHVDVLCLDKTGTLTQGDMRVERVEQLTKDLPIPLADWMGAFLAHIDDNNATFQAMRACFPNRDIPQTPTGKIPFSSQRKWSAVTFPELGTLVVGAPDRMTGTRLPEELSAEIRRGKRVLMIASTSFPIDPDGPLPEMTALAALVLSAPIRPGAAHTLDYFRREGVRIKVISGDHPAAAAAVAAQAGLEDASWVDMSQVNTEDELLRAAQQYTVFGRVSPEQKRQLVQAFQDQGHRVAMTGDGVNDILAMRKADCSIAMAHGSEAARQAAQVVLLDSDFTVLPNILLEGRRVVNNMTRVAGVFFVKTIYSILLSLFCVLADLPFPPHPHPGGPDRPVYRGVSRLLPVLCSRRESAHRAVPSLCAAPFPAQRHSHPALVGGSAAGRRSSGTPRRPDPPGPLPGHRHGGGGCTSEILSPADLSAGLPVPHRLRRIFLRRPAVSRCPVPAAPSSGDSPRGAVGVCRRRPGGAAVRLHSLPCPPAGQSRGASGASDPEGIASHRPGAPTAPGRLLPVSPL